MWPKTWRITWKKNWRRRKPAFGLYAAFLFLALLLSACGGQAPPSEPDYFIPPSLQPQASPISLETPTPILPSATPECANSLDFLEDITIPDGTAFAPGVPVDKRWLVANDGTCNWDSRYRVRLISGPDLGADVEQALFPARAGSEVEIRIQFTAPEEQGSYRSSWQAVDPGGNPFGDLFFLDIEVDASLAPQESQGE